MISTLVIKHTISHCKCFTFNLPFVFNSHVRFYKKDRKENVLDIFNNYEMKKRSINFFSLFPKNDT